MQIKENIKALRHWPLWGEFTSEFPAQTTSNADNVSIWWRHHAAWSSTGVTMQDIIMPSPHFISCWLLCENSIDSDSFVENRVLYWRLSMTYSDSMARNFHSFGAHDTIHYKTIKTFETKVTRSFSWIISTMNYTYYYTMTRICTTMPWRVNSCIFILRSFCKWIDVFVERQRIFSSITTIS